ncbi:MAG: 8-oxo-dGTP diphosphatase MutT [Pseudomonadota bacterium]
MLMTVVAVAFVNGEGEVLLAQRPPGKFMAGMWEFPGGKIEAGETPEQALIRECHEELGVEITAQALKPFTFISHAYPEKDFHLLMPLYLCHEWGGEMQGIEGQSLAWVQPEDMINYLVTPADLPLVEALCDGIPPA